MPELPEVEALRRSLIPGLVGQRVAHVDIARADVIAGAADPDALLRGQRVVQLLRHGKQLALLGDRGAVVCIHLGMSGSVTLAGQDQPPRPHTHVVWRLDGGSAVRFADARRFGGVWAYPDQAALWGWRWAALGPDAMTITPGQLAAGLARTRRGLKAALLDQALVAGLGNIYVDELLFRVGLSPSRAAASVSPGEARRVVGAMRRLLITAAARGGSSLRDYVDGRGRAGGYQRSHRVYGRAGLPCRCCGVALASGLIAGRMTVWCPACQR